MLTAATLFTFAVEEGARPSGKAIVPILVLVFLLAGFYWLLTTERAAAVIPAVRKLPGGQTTDQPRLEFLDGLDYGQKPVKTPEGQFVENGYFCGVSIVNVGTARAQNVWAEIAFFSPSDGQPLLPTLKGRWANADQPDAAPQPVSASSPRYTRIDIPANEEPEPLDLYVLFSGPSERAVYAYNNENHMALGRDNRCRVSVPHDHFLIDVSIKGDSGVRLRGVWELQALTPTPYDVRRWLI